MKIQKLTFLSLIIFLACNNSQLSDKEVEERAFAITAKLNESNINIFREWNFGLRGQAEIWTKTKEDSTLFSCMYFKSIDSTSIIISKNFLYSNEFQLNTELDTSKYWRFEFIKTIDNKTKIIGVDNNGQDSIFEINQTVNSLFKNMSPFAKIDSLSKFKDELKVYGISYIGRLGDFIQFYLTYQDVLTYISDYSTFDPRYKKNWIKEFSRGREIKPNWNLRRLDRPLEGS